MIAGLRVWSSRLIAMTGKELRQLRRDGFLMLAIAFLFIVHIYTTQGIRLELNHASVYVHDADHSDASREIAYRFVPPDFQLKGELADARAGSELLDRGKALVVVDIPDRFEQQLLRGQVADVQVLIDASNTVLGSLAASDTTQIIARFSFGAALERMGLTDQALDRMPMVEDQHRVWYNPNQNDLWFIPLAELMTVITILAIMLPAATVVREKERGTIEQLVVSPLTPAQILAPKIVATTLTILLGTAASLFLVLVPVFHVPTRGSGALFFAVVALYSVATSGIGLYIATLSRNLAQAAMLAILILMPMILLSGAWTPPEAMPEGLRVAMSFSPLFYLIDVGYEILLKGAGLGLVWPALLRLAGLGTVIFAFGTWRFRRQFG